MLLCYGGENREYFSLLKISREEIQLSVTAVKIKKQISIYRRHRNLSEIRRWPFSSPNEGTRGRGSDMFTSCFFGRTEWNRTVYFIRRIFLRWAAARHTQLFLLFLSTRLKKEEKNPPWDHLLLHSLCFSFLDGLTGESGGGYLHIYTTIFPFPWHIRVWKPNATALKHKKHITLLKWQFTWKWCSFPFNEVHMNGSIWDLKWQKSTIKSL